MQSDTSDPRLVPRKKVIPATGDWDVEYFWDGRKAPKIQIIGRLADQLSGYSLIQRDLELALKWTQEAMRIAKEDSNWGKVGYWQADNRGSIDYVRGYFIASLTFYGKCFTSAAGRHAQVSRDWLDQEFKEMHDFYMTFRHNLAAHSGDEQLESARSYVLLHPNKKKLLPFLPTSRFQPDLVSKGDQQLGFERLIVHVTKKVEDKYDKLADKINEYAFSRRVEFWAAAAERAEAITVNPPRKG